MTVTTRPIKSSDLEELIEGPAPAPPPRTAKLRRRAKRVAMVSAIKVRQWRLHLAAPGVAGAVLVSASLGGIANYAWPGLGVFVGLGVLGLFSLRLDYRM